MEKDRVLPPRLDLGQPRPDDFDPVRRKDGRASPGFDARIRSAVDDPGNPGFQQSPSARGCLSLVPTRLEGDKHLRARAQIPGGGESRDFGVGSAEFRVPPLADDLLAPNDDTTDLGIGPDPPPPLSTEADGPIQVATIPRRKRKDVPTRPGDGAARLDQKVTLTLSDPWSSRSPGR